VFLLPFSSNPLCCCIPMRNKCRDVAGRQVSSKKKVGSCLQVSLFPAFLYFLKFCGIQEQYLAACHV